MEPTLIENEHSAPNWCVECDKYVTPTFTYTNVDGEDYILCAACIEKDPELVALKR